MFGWLTPKESIDEAELRKGLRRLLADGACGQTMAVLTTGAFLIAFALQLGASNTTIGMLAAVGPLSQTLQVPAVYLLERVRRRKWLVIPTATLSRLAWFAIAALPFYLPREAVLPVFFAALLIHFGFGAVAG